MSVVTGASIVTVMTSRRSRRPRASSRSTDTAATEARDASRTSPANTARTPLRARQRSMPRSAPDATTRGRDDRGALDDGDHRGALGEVVGAARLERPVGVGDEAIDPEVRPLRVRYDRPEELGAIALDEGELRRAEAARLRLDDDRVDDVAVEERVQIGRRDEGGRRAEGSPARPARRPRLLRSGLDVQEPEATGVDRDASTNGCVHRRGRYARSRRFRAQAARRARIDVTELLQHGKQAAA